MLQSGVSERSVSLSTYYRLGRRSGEDIPTLTREHLGPNGERARKHTIGRRHLHTRVELQDSVSFLIVLATPTQDERYAI